MRQLKGAAILEIAIAMMTQKLITRCEAIRSLAAAMAAG